MAWLVRSLKWLSGALLALLVVTALGLAVYAWRASPVTEGLWSVPAAAAGKSGLHEEVRIERDRYGVPTIQGKSVQDVMFGLGVAHAQDRLWQMETHRRIGAGRLAEAFGPAALDNDKFLRALGVRRAAAAQWQQASAESKALLMAYSAGVNHVIRDKLRARPPEFIALGLQPEPWDPIDSLAWSIMMAWDLGGNWTTELQRLRLSSKLSLERINELLPPYPGDRPVPTRDYVQLYRDLGLAQASATQAWLQLPEIAPPSGIEGTGSNNWVLSGSKTVTGKPLLANDPHLGLSAPALWYFARLKAPGLNVGGVTLPGLPTVVLGQNEQLAWGFTNTGPDVQDLYIEQIDPQDPQRFRTPTGTAAFETEEEIIKVKGQADVKFTVRRTRHGPVISDAGTFNEVLNARHVLALRWTALDSDADILAVAMGLSRAQTVREFVQAAQHWVAPMQNMVVADPQGHIGMISAGRLPLRSPDNDLHGVAPAPGWEARYDWVGWVPKEETPREMDPPRGWIATANQRIHSPDYKHFVTADWTLPYRQQRIEQVLQSRDKHSMEELAQLQSDVKSLAAARLLPWLLKARSTHPLAAAAAKELAGFDGTMKADRPAPLIFWAWQRALARSLVNDKIGAELFDKAFAGRTFQDALEGILERNDAWWCNRVNAPQAQTCAQRVDEALTTALEELSLRFGSDLSRWTWGAAHMLWAEHRPFSKVAALSPLFSLSVPVSGDTHTVNAQRVGLAGPPETRYRSSHGPSLRGLYDVDDRTRSRVMHSSGQSGLPWLKSYRDFVQPWAQGDYIPLWPSAAEAAQGGVLVLRPESGG